MSSGIAGLPFGLFFALILFFWGRGSNLSVLLLMVATFSRLRCILKASRWGSWSLSRRALPLETQLTKNVPNIRRRLRSPKVYFFVLKHIGKNFRSQVLWRHEPPYLPPQDGSKARLKGVLLDVVALPETGETPFSKCPPSLYHKDIAQVELVVDNLTLHFFEIVAQVFKVHDQLLAVVGQEMLVVLLRLHFEVALYVLVGCQSKELLPDRKAHVAGVAVGVVLTFLPNRGQPVLAGPLLPFHNLHSPFRELFNPIDRLFVELSNTDPKQLVLINGNNLLIIVPFRIDLRKHAGGPCQEGGLCVVERTAKQLLLLLGIILLLLLLDAGEVGVGGVKLEGGAERNFGGGDGWHLGASEEQVGVRLQVDGFAEHFILHLGLLLCCLTSRPQNLWLLSHQRCLLLLQVVTVALLDAHLRYFSTELFLEVVIYDGVYLFIFDLFIILEGVFQQILPKTALLPEISIGAGRYQLLVSTFLCDFIQTAGPSSVEKVHLGGFRRWIEVEAGSYHLQFYQQQQKYYRLPMSNTKVTIVIVF